MTSHEVICAVIAHYRSMPGQCITDSGTCLYRRADGNKCFIGALLSDDDYDSMMDQKVTGIAGIAEYIPGFKDIPISDMAQQDATEFLMHLQDMHDEATTAERWTAIPDHLHKLWCVQMGNTWPTEEEIEACRGMTFTLR